MGSIPATSVTTSVDKFLSNVTDRLKIQFGY
jgi:hypothetical protein